jgi:hypothetical protein
MVYKRRGNTARSILRYCVRIMKDRKALTVYWRIESPARFCLQFFQRTIGSGWNLLKERCLFKPVVCRSNLPRQQQMALSATRFHRSGQCSFEARIISEEPVAPSIARLDLSNSPPPPLVIPEVVYRNKYWGKKRIIISLAKTLQISRKWIWCLVYRASLQ